jgi:hypothetical protein
VRRVLRHARAAVGGSADPRRVPYLPPPPSLFCRAVVEVPAPGGRLRSVSVGGGSPAPVSGVLLRVESKLALPTNSCSRHRFVFYQLSFLCITTRILVFGYHRWTPLSYCSVYPASSDVLEVTGGGSPGLRACLRLPPLLRPSLTRVAHARGGTLLCPGPPAPHWCGFLGTTFDVHHSRRRGRGRKKEGQCSSVRVFTSGPSVAYASSGSSWLLSSVARSDDGTLRLGFVDLGFFLRCCFGLENALCCGPESATRGPVLYPRGGLGSVSLFGLRPCS